jgi:putative FmdB family regulatory protein
MPLYEYKCSSCGHQQEFLQKWSDAPMTVCTACGKETFSKMLTAAGFQLKGSGWYATDFKGSGTKPAPKADATKGDAKAESKGEVKSESKTETKATDSGTKDAAPKASGSGGAAAGS